MLLGGRRTWWAGHYSRFCSNQQEVVEMLFSSNFYILYSVEPRATGECLRKMVKEKGKNDRRMNQYSIMAGVRIWNCVAFGLTTPIKIILRSHANVPLHTESGCDSEYYDLMWLLAWRGGFIALVNELFQFCFYFYLYSMLVMNGMVGKLKIDNSNRKLTTFDFQILFKFIFDISIRFAQLLFINIDIFRKKKKKICDGFWHYAQNMQNKCPFATFRILCSTRSIRIFE